jgi:putative holliday junction resolvase
VPEPAVTPDQQRAQATLKAREAERVMAFDFGMRRIGIAIGVRLLGTATPLTVLENSYRGPAWHKLDNLMREWKPAALLVGYPITLQGSEQAITLEARKFAHALYERYALPVAEHDERFTSRIAAAQFTEARQNGSKRRKDAAMLDAVAAQIILESWFSHDSSNYNTEN